MGEGEEWQRQLERHNKRARQSLSLTLTITLFICSSRQRVIIMNVTNLAVEVELVEVDIHTFFVINLLREEKLINCLLFDEK